MLDVIRKKKEDCVEECVEECVEDFSEGSVKAPVTLVPRSRWAPIQERAICKRCKAQCCTVMNVILDHEMVEGGLRRYKHEYEEPTGFSWIEPRARLRKRKDGSCVYFDREEKTCSIYHRRPYACKAFFCGKGTKNNRTWLHIKETAEKEGTP